MSRVRRLVLSDRYFFVTCDLRPRRNLLWKSDFESLAKVIDARRQIHGFHLTAWVFLPDRGRAIIYARVCPRCAYHFPGDAFHQGEINQFVKHRMAKAWANFVTQIFRPRVAPGEMI